ncbi:MAG: GNAT family N-acetyltransferase [Hyphomicrobiales bacterium]
MAEFEITLSESDSKGTFSMYAPKDGHDVPVKSGEMTFSKAGEALWIFDHVEVNEDMKGTGAAMALVKYGVDVARKRNLKVIPLCPFAKAQFKRHIEYHDVLKG